MGAGGSLLLYDRSELSNFKDDGVNWTKKKNHTRVSARAAH